MLQSPMRRYSCLSLLNAAGPLASSEWTHECRLRCLRAAFLLGSSLRSLLTHRVGAARPGIHGQAIDPNLALLFVIKPALPPGAGFLPKKLFQGATGLAESPWTSALAKISRAARSSQSKCIQLKPGRAEDDRDSLTTAHLRDLDRHRPYSRLGCPCGW